MASVKINKEDRAMGTPPETFKERILRINRESNWQTVLAMITIEAKRSKRSPAKIQEQVENWIKAAGDEKAEISIPVKSDSKPDATEEKRTSKTVIKSGKAKRVSEPKQRELPSEDSGTEGNTPAQHQKVAKLSNVPPKKTPKTRVSAAPKKVKLNTTGLCLCGCGGPVEEPEHQFIKGHGRLLKMRFHKLEVLASKLEEEKTKLKEELPKESVAYAVDRWPDVTKNWA